MNQLLDLCESDPAVREVMRRHGTSRQTLCRLFDFLVDRGAGGSPKGHYAAASVLCSGQMLDFALRNLEAFQSPIGQPGAEYPALEAFEAASPPESPDSCSGTSTAVPPIQLQLEDLLADENYEWRVVGSPFTIAGAQTVHIRVESVKEPGRTQIRAWGAHECVNVRRENGKR